MANCDMCGKETNLYKALIEGTELQVCKECTKYGKVIGTIKREIKKEKKQLKKTIFLPKKEMVQLIVNDYAKRIKQKREQLKLKQEELAKLISEKESLIHKIESGHFEPSIKLARKLEKFLRIRLIEQHEVEKASIIGKASTEEFTLGDFVKVKK